MDPDGSMMSLTGVTTASGWYGWNVTVEAQDAMRTEASFDVLLDIVGGSGYRDALFYSKEASNPLNQPELVLRFTSGSNALPDILQPLAPANGSWAVTSGIHVAPEPRPVLNWSVPTAVPIAGWEVQLDTSDGFDSSDLLTVTSFNSNGFDVQNGVMHRRPTSISVMSGRGAHEPSRRPSRSEHGPRSSTSAFRTSRPTHSPATAPA